MRSARLATRLGLFLVLSCLSACAHHAPEQPTTPNWVKLLTPLPTPTSLFKTYPVRAAFQRGGPKLTIEQRDWIQRILHSKNYGKLRSRLRFVDIPGTTTPIVVYVDRAGPGQTDRGGHVIGEGCNGFFDPVEHGLFPASESACSPPTPKPVN